jgi:hypothetical protein
VQRRDADATGEIRPRKRTVRLAELVLEAADTELLVRVVELDDATLDS